MSAFLSCDNSSQTIQKNYKNGKSESVLEKYKKYIKENNLNTKITDLWGKEYDVIEDDIRVIFTKSQFKLWNYYKNIDEIGMTGWEVYKACFKAYGCTLNKCLEDEDKLKKFVLDLLVFDPDEVELEAGEAEPAEPAPEETAETETAETETEKE